MMRNGCSLAMFAVLLCVPAGAHAAEAIWCEGDYAGHLQGVATDGAALYWSFTVELVKTDLNGRRLTSVPVPRHHGDLCVRTGVVYVAVNRGVFNQENAGVSEVSAYDARTLAHLRTWDLPDMPHGAGGMTWKDDSFYVVGGLPATHECNYVYEYDGDFRLRRRHELATGFTLMGIQTASFENGRFVFGIYGSTGNPGGSLECPPDLRSFVRRTGGGDVGFLKLGGRLWTAETPRDATTKRYRGLIRPNDGFLSEASVFRPIRTGRGRVMIFFEADGTNGWRDCGYELRSDGYRPLHNRHDAFVPVAVLSEAASLPAVGIGGDRSYSTGDLVRAVRRVALRDEVLTLHLPGASAAVRADVRLDRTLQAVRHEAEVWGVRVTMGKRKGLD